jgi:hypothetical protein
MDRGRGSIHKVGIHSVVMPAKAGIQYSVKSGLDISSTAYWIIRLRG